MNMRNYMKKKGKLEDAVSLTTEELIAKVSRRNLKLSKKTVLISIFALCIAIPAIHAVLSFNSLKTISLEEIGSPALASVPVAATTAKKDLISIPSGTVKANPFLPYRDIGGSSNAVKDVPKFDLVEPPEVISESSEAARIMDTVVSGILYDKYSPSAILNIEGNDYLVKKGDVVNNYKVVSILQDSVTVKLGNNTFKAGIGEILTEGSVNYNDVSNLNKKFGGKK